jgi:flagellar basal body-associated protein FliL
MPKLIPDDRSRQGPKGRPVLGVLISALALLAVIGAGLMIWMGATSPDNPSQEASREAVTGSPSGSSNANPTNRISPANPAYPVPADPSATGATKQ